MMVNVTALKRAFSNALITMWPAFGWMRDKRHPFPPKPKGLPIDLDEDSKRAEGESEHQSGEIGCGDFSLL
jgi:hypothetical protein